MAFRVIQAVVSHTFHSFRKQNITRKKRAHKLSGREANIWLHRIVRDPLKAISYQLMPSSANIPTLNSLVISQENGKPLSFRILIPPNIAKAAPQDAIMVKIEAYVEGTSMAPERIDRGLAYSAEPPYIIIAMLVEHWCKGKLCGMLQLTRKQLHELLAPLQGEASVYMLKTPNKPLDWEDGIIPSLHPLLKENKDAANKIVHKLKAERPAEIKKAVEDNLMKMEVDGSTNFLAITLPSKESIVYTDVKEMLVSYGFTLELSNRKWWIRNRHKTLNFLARYWHDLKGKYKAKFSKNFLEKTAKVDFAKIACEIEESSGEHTVDIKLHAPGIDNKVFGQNLTKGLQYVENGDQVVLIANDQLKKFTDIQCQLQGTPSVAFAPRVRRFVRNPEIESIYGVIKNLTENITLPAEWQSRIRTFQDVNDLEHAPLKQKHLDLLRKYQQIGVAWLWKLYKNGLGGILADEMGLGKTLQALAIIDCVLREGGKATALIVCPASLVLNWKRECERYFPELNMQVHHGPNRAKDSKEIQNADILITSYTTFSRDQKLLSGPSYSIVIADEAQHIKNPNSRNANSLKSVQAKSRFVLTGTPIENSVNDLRSIFNFIMPGYLIHIPANIKNADQQWYYNRTQEQAIPYILRRTKHIVAPELPKKIEQILFCEMTSEQDSLYSKIKEETKQAIFNLEMSKTSEEKIRMAAFKQLLRLRQVCADPRLLDEKQTSDNSAKLKALLEILDEAQDGNHRLLIFSPFVSLLKLLREELENRNLPYAYLDGQTKDRVAVCDQFNNDHGIPAFLISLKAGGVGLNITGADIVVHFDPWWNPAVEDQATDRAHRIGQQEIVTSIKFIMANTIEEKVLDIQKKKAQLLQDLFEANAKVNNELDLEIIKNLVD